MDSIAAEVYRATPCVPICARFLNTANTRFARFHQQDEIGSMEVLAFAVAKPCYGKCVLPHLVFME